MTAAIEHRRFNEIVDASLAALSAASSGGANGFGVPLLGRVDGTRVGVLGHSRGGLNVLDWAAAHTGAVKSVVLVAPFYDPSEKVPDVPAALLLGTCDGETGSSGAGYLTRAIRQGRTTPSWRLVVRGFNHNNYNRTLVRIRNDDAQTDKRARCARSMRPKATGQQAFLVRVATAHFAHTMLAAPGDAWQLPTASLANLNGQTVTLNTNRV